MGWFAHIGLGSFALISLLVGIRLTALGVKRRGLPELLIGSALLFTGFIGPVCVLCSSVWGGAKPELAPYAWAAGIAAINVGVTQLFIFNWRVFHGSSRGAGLAAIAAIAFTWGTYFASLATSGFATVGITDAYGFASLAGRCGAFVWAAVVSFAQFSSARKRLELGLVEPAIVRRLRFWGVGASCAASVFAVNLVRWLLGDVGPTTLIARTVIPTLAIGAAIHLALAFVPVPAPLRFILARRSRRHSAQAGPESTPGGPFST